MTVLRHTAIILCIWTVVGICRELTVDSLQTATNISLIRGDTTWTRGSHYGSFADVFALLPAAHVFDRGSVGQQAEGCLFSGLPEQSVVSFDGLILDDPLTGQADLNYIPVEAVYSFQIAGASDERYTPVFQTLQIASRDLAGTPVRTRVAYRTGGNGYDDIDARLGVRASPNLSINAGGILKNYAGTTLYEKYRAQKVNTRIERRLGDRWHLKYLFLMNKYDLDEPLFDEILNFTGLSRLHKTEKRYDHGIEVAHTGGFKTFLQYTDATIERYGYRHSVVDQVHDVVQVRLTLQWQKMLAGMPMQTGSHWRYAGLESKNWGRHRQNEVRTWLQLQKRFKETWTLGFGAQLSFRDEYGTAFLPELSMTCRPSEGWRITSWASQTRLYPGFHQLFTEGPFARGDTELQPMKSLLGGVLIEKSSCNGSILTAVTANKISDKIAAVYRTGYAMPVYENLKNDLRVAFDLAGHYRLLSWIALYVHLQHLLQQEYAILHQPAADISSYVQFSGIFFDGNLDATIRLGLAFSDARMGPQPYYADWSEQTYQYGETAAIPSVHAVFAIKDVTIFLAYRNLPGSEYTLVPLYPMPKQQLRWGFVWNFWD